ncbi:MAG: DMT family transporter [Acidimicrobiaceae bacterium]|nr:DMT family transporter [Acidimicrobiaceae bacterium]
MQPGQSSAARLNVDEESPRVARCGGPDRRLPLNFNLVVAIFLAIGSAFANALNVTTQHVASTAAPIKKGAWRLALYLLQNPLWLFGIGALVGAFVLQAVALDHGKLSVVQSLLVTSVVFTLVIGRVWLHRRVGAAAWVSALVISTALAVFLIAAEPTGGHPETTAPAWLPALLTCSAVVAVSTFAAGRGSPLRHAALYAISSGIVWAVFATFLKSVADTFSSSGLVTVATNGEVYGLVVAGIVGTVLTQAALHRGPLAVSESLMVIINPLVSILLSVWIFGEHIEGSGARIATAVLAFVAVALGVVFLGLTAPSFEAAPAKQPV